MDGSAHDSDAGGDGDVPPDLRRGLLDTVQRLAGIGVWSYDDRTETLYVSDRTRQIHDIADAGALTVEELTACYSAADQSRVLAGFEGALEDGEPFTADVAISSEGTTERTVRLRCEPYREDGTVIGLRGTAADVTDEKLRERRIELLRETNMRLKQASSPAGVAEVLVDAAKNILGLVYTTVRLVDDSQETLHTVVVTEECVERAGERPDYPVEDDNPASRVFRTGEPEVYREIGPNFDDWDRGDLVCGIYVPIGDHGVLSTGDVVAEAFNEQDVEAASLIGELGGDAITRLKWGKRSRAI
jgi:hypothetical protein